MGLLHAAGALLFAAGGNRKSMSVARNPNRHRYQSINFQQYYWSSSRGLPETSNPTLVLPYIVDRVREETCCGIYVKASTLTTCRTPAKSLRNRNKEGRKDLLKTFKTALALRSLRPRPQTLNPKPALQVPFNTALMVLNLGQLGGHLG